MARMAYRVIVDLELSTFSLGRRGGGRQGGEGGGGGGGGRGLLADSLPNRGKKQRERERCLN